MNYHKIVTLKNGAECCIRSATEADGQAVLDNFLLTHGETDYLLTYPDEMHFTAAQEGAFLQAKYLSEREIELIAVVDGSVAATAGISAVGGRDKLRHRAELGVSVAEAFWGLGIGGILTAACIECAKAAGYLQLELEVVAGNERALSLYQKAGFTEYGRNPKGFLSRSGAFQEVVSMRLEL